MTRPWEDFAYTDAPRAECAWSLDRDFPALEGDRDTDIAVIGGGFTGLSAALNLAQAGEKVTVLEANAPGWGASGRNGGFCCLGGAQVDQGTLVRRFGADQAGLWVETKKAAIDLVAGLLEEHKIDAQRHSDGELVLAHRPAAFHKFGEARVQLARHGIAAETLSPGALEERGLSAAGTHGGLHVKIGFGLDPGAYVRGLARAAEAAGADIRARTAVLALTPESQHIRLETRHGNVTARRVLIATNGYSSDVLPPWLAGRFLPMQSSVLMTRPLSADEQKAQGWTSDLMAYDSRRMLHYFRRLPDGRFLFGMRGGLRATPAREARVMARVRADFAAMFPAWAGVDIAHYWSGLINLARAGTPYVGPVPGMKNTWIAMAYHGDGVAMGSYAGTLAADLIRGRAPERPFPTVMQAPLERFPLGRHRRMLLAAATPFVALRDRL